MMKKTTMNVGAQRVTRFMATMLFLLFLGLNAHAVPAKPGQSRQLTLADGTTVSATLVGDEYGHYWLTQDGKAYLSQDGSDVYRVVDPQTIRKRGLERKARANKQRAQRLAPRALGDVGNYIGQKKGIIILVNFKDTKFTATQEDYDKIANEIGYSEGNFKGSMYDYFYDQSNGVFMLNFDVVGPYTVSKNASYYGSNDSSGYDKHPAEMVIDALKQADADVNFADYDWDGDGYVDQIYVVYAGKGEADGGSSNTIWPHSYNLSEAGMYGDGTGKQKLDGVYIDTYACGSELNSYGQTDGIGTMCHEFSHCLGYPDFYDIDYSGGQGMADWDLMDSGSYNGGGYLPAGYTAYERWMAGWMEPIELTTTQTVEGMKALQEGGEAYIIYNKGHTDEYYILENRQLMGWDKSLPGAGLLIIHVDYDAMVWASNQPNDDPSHQRMTWIPADNKYQYDTYWGTKYYTTAGMATDPFPYGKVNAFGKNTTPAAKLYNKNIDGTYYLDSSVEDITQNADGTISFIFKAPSNIALPVFSPNAGRYMEAQTVTISCATEGATIYYTTDGTEPTRESQEYTGPITISETTTLKAFAVLDDEESEVATAKYVIVKFSDSDKFVRVASVDDIVAGQRYIIACPSKAKAAGQLNSTFLNTASVTVSADTIFVTEDVSVFFIDDHEDGGWTLRNEETNEYLYAIEAKKLGYTDNKAQTWTLKDGDDGGVIMSFDYNGQDFGTMLCNSYYSRFTTYTSSPTSLMIPANLYVEYSGGSGPVDDKQDIILTFTETEVEAVIGEDFIAPTLTIDPLGTVVDVTYTSSNPKVATVDKTTGEVTLVDEGTTTITARFEGNDTYNPAQAKYKLTVRKETVPVIVGVTMTATEGGSIRLGDDVVSGDTKVTEVETDSVLTFEFIADEGYELDSVTVNGEDMTAEVVDGVLTLNDVSEDITVVATFKKQSFTVTATAGEGGSIALSSEQAEWGDDVTVTIVPDEDYELATLIVDGSDVTSEVTDLKYVIHNVRSDVEVTATFRPTAIYITIGPEGMVAFSCDYDLDFSGVDGLSAYIACGYVSKANVVVMVPVTSLPAREGMVVKGEPGTYKVSCAKSSDYYVNILKGNVEEADIAPTDGNQTNYFLTGGDDGLVFSRVDKEGTTGANCAILQLPTAIEVEGGRLDILFIEQGGEETGDKCDVNRDGIVDVADISTIIDAMASRARIWK
jgi:M6 family metalloprotease-like protein